MQGYWGSEGERKGQNMWKIPMKKHAHGWPQTSLLVSWINGFNVCTDKRYFTLLMVKKQTILHGKEIPEARKLSGCILLAPIFMRNRDCRTGYLQNSLLENFHFEEFCDWIQLWWSSVVWGYNSLCKLRFPKILWEMLSHGQLDASMNTWSK